ncbi:MAG: DEAD/DEAH box helicase family protein [Defluviitaleaceae bacterium]|nr:DEAD/DEAH box helicase family protein [Defluviitaleaceae bacterium]
MDGLPIRAKPYAHQAEACHFACRLSGADGCDAVPISRDVVYHYGNGLTGTGKSLTAIAVAGRLFLYGKANRVLVVAPLSILGVWDDEFSKFANFDYELTVLSGMGAKRQMPAATLATATRTSCNLL